MSKEAVCPELESWVMRTRLVRHRQAVRAEIERHKWFESERAGYDIGWLRAEVDWRIRFGPRRRWDGDET